MISAAKSLEEALGQFDRAAARTQVEGAEAQRAAILERFPLEQWHTMTLEKYALGQEDSEETFCRWMEFRSQDLGSIRGGSARKLIIYKHKDKPGWYFPKMFGDEQIAWEHLRADFIQAFEHTNKGEWAEIDGLELLGQGSVLRLKTLHLYFPDEVLPVYSNDHLRHFLRLLKRPDEEASGHAVVQTNRNLLAALHGVPGLAGWNTTELARFLYWWDHPRDAHRVVKIAPGEKAKYWDECLQNGYICVGWDDVGDLSHFESKEAFRERFAEAYPYKGHRPAITRKSNELWTLTELEPGDLVVANQGTSKVVAVGEVVEPGYQWREDRPKFKHTVAVDWDTRYEKAIPAQNAWRTVTVGKVPYALFELIISEVPAEGPKPKLSVPVDPLYRQIAAALERKGQLILYGPPGTGKTYTARRFAVWWLLRQTGEAGANAVLGDSERMALSEKRLSTAQVARRVWWVVANPKQWSWEQLSEEGQVTYKYGRIKKNYALVQRGDWVIGYQATPDKKIVALARISGELQPREGGEPGIELEWVAALKDGITYDELQKDPVLAGSEPLRSRCQGTLFALSEAEADHLFSLLAERNPDLPVIDAGEDGEIGRLTRVTFHPSYTYEDFIEGFRPSEQGTGGLALKLEDGVFKRVCRAAQAHPDRPYLILVDEINRGNVAKILGELLTLLERDKRGLTVSLPQSKETFSIPPNVYLLGTMNTADRSIKLLDAALRRRFAFIEFMPDLELLRGAAVGELALDEFLEELNRRIARSEGREKQIGHAYLLDGGNPVSEIEDFACCFREEILPLLQEYCYDEYGTLAKFIGGSLVDAEAQMLDQEKVADSEQLLAALVAEFGAETEAE
jgi:5-methylcytosine-specific restriction protein B